MSTDTVSGGSAYVKRLAVFLGLVYFAQGIGQSAGLLNQPLMFYLVEGLGLTSAQANNYLACLTIPWTIKPLYGFISDFFPLLGYRRRTWLTLTNFVAAAGFVWLTGLTEVSHIVAAMLITAVGTAASDVIVDAIMVENGDKYKATDTFQSVQWCLFYLAFVTTALAGGLLCEWFSPERALHIAAGITILAPLSVIVATWLVVKEDRARLDVAALKERSSDLWEARKQWTLWAVALFLGFWYFKPSIGTIWYDHQVNKLGFSQAFIGYLGCASAAGSVLGSVLYNWYFANKTLKFQIVFSVATGALSTLSNLLLLTPGEYTNEVALFFSFLTGIAAIIATLATLGLAARVCPKKPRASRSRCSCR